MLIKKLTHLFRPRQHVLTQMPNQWYVCEQCFETFQTLAYAEAMRCITRIRKPAIVQKREYKRFARWLNQHDNVSDDKTQR